MKEILLDVNTIDLLTLYGENNKRLQLFRQSYPGVRFVSRGDTLKLSGESSEVEAARKNIMAVIAMINQKKELTDQIVQDILNGGEPHIHRLSYKMNTATIVHGRDGKPIKPKTVNQKKLVDSSLKNDIVFAIGPAGTGKTYTAVAMAVKALKERIVKKIILTRPAVEAGESLGFLPGDLKDKVDPYLRPLYDALDDMLPLEKLSFFMTNRIIEVAPLAYMRGRTLDNAFVILDEAQNTTSMQLKMFLTRLGPNAKCIITGDLSQIDLPKNQKSGLRTAIRILKDVDGIGIVKLTAEDVVRHRLVKEIIKAYDVESDMEHKKREELKNNPKSNES